MSRFSRSPITAVLGPTNTGKTHLAVERMLGHSSGMMGFPLRLLAREVYDRVVAAKGAASVALVTGEERIWPETARYLLCTAEAMPLAAVAKDGQAAEGARDVAFVALDEAQIGQDRERGHVFTSRLLHARGREETMILGSASLTPVVRHLLPEAEIISRPRFSTLSYAGPKKLSRLPPRSVIVAFSAEEVYAIAEALRRFSGGAAVVMGALSPRTRNAQVAMFQAGEVDYLVATDAIGMGLNLDVSHVAFASLNKFDGTRQRRLTVAEMAQIAGRAGRHQRDGSFGSIGAEAAFTDEEVEAITEHRFPPLDWLYWRNPAPAMDSVASLIAGLEAPPPDVSLRAAPESTDLAVLRRLEGDAEAMALVSGSAGVRRLWSAASLPDFTKAGPEAHGRFVARLWRDLGQGIGHIDADWFRHQLAELDKPEGRVEAIGDRIAKVRTWCYIAHRPDWLAEPEAMADLARGVETRLSDALHNALTARFVDRRTTVLLRSLGQGAATLPVAVDSDGAVRVDGEAIGHLDGFAFRVDPAARAGDRKMLLAAAERHLAVELAGRASALASAADDALELVTGPEGAPAIQWLGGKVAVLEKGRTRLAPRIRLDAAIAALDPAIVAAVVARLKTYVDSQSGEPLRPLLTIAARGRDADATPAVRAVLAGIADGYGCVARADVDSSLAAMKPEERDELRRMGIKTGSLDLYHPALLKPAAMRWIAALEGAWTGQAAPKVPPPGINLIKADGDTPVAASGFRRIGDHWLRVDLAERVALQVHGGRRTALAQNAAKPAEAVVEPARTPAVEPTAAAEPTAALIGDSPALSSEAPAEATGAPTPAPATASPAPPEGAFRIDPELARSIGLPLADRIKLYRMLGFRTVGPQREITAEEEADLWWTWRGREKPSRGRPPHRRGEAPPRGKRPPRRDAASTENAPSGPPATRWGKPPARGGDRRDDRPRGKPHGERRPETAGHANPAQRDGRHRDDRSRGERNTGGKGMRHQPMPPRARPPVNNPFGALADLLAKPGKDKPSNDKPGKDKPGKDGAE